MSQNNNRLQIYEKNRSRDKVNCSPRQQTMNRKSCENMVVVSLWMAGIIRL